MQALFAFADKIRVITKEINYTLTRNFSLTLFAILDNIYRKFANKARIGVCQKQGWFSINLSHGLVKEGKVPPKEIDRAIERREKFDRAFEQHTYIEEVE